jgi:hypothetical protein
MPHLKMKLNPYIKKIHLNYSAKKYTVLFLEQLIVLLELEISLSDCFKILGERSNTLFIQNLSMDIYHDLLLGYTLENTLFKHNYIFNSWLCAMITISPHGNLLQKTLKQHLKHHQKIKKLKHQLIQQLIYPALIFSACICLLFFYNYQIMPSYQNLFKQLNASPPNTFNLEIMTNKIIYIIPLFIIFFNTNIQDKLPLWGTLKQQYHWYNWFSLMQIGVQSGMTFHQSLSAIAPLIKNEPQRDWHKQLLQNIEFGHFNRENFKAPETLPKFIKQYFDLFVPQTESAQFYKKITQMLEQNLQNTLKKLQKYLPIVALSIMSIFSGYIIYIFYQPLLKLSELI